LITDDNEQRGLRPTSVAIARHARLKIGRFSQSADETMVIASLDLCLTALRHLMDCAGV
jgi:ATP-binding cassette subfamily F protein 3